MLKLILPFPPSVNRLWRAGKAGKVYRSNVYTEWRKLALWQLISQTRHRFFSTPYKLTILAVRPDKRKRDIGNLEKAVNDILVSAKVVEDDHLCHWIEAKWVESGPSCTIIIEELPLGGDDGQEKRVQEKET
jgi:crossover junction endodeoxyribonuclease RusA